MNCVTPATTRLFRKVDRIFVEALKQKMREDPTAPGTIVVVTCYTCYVLTKPLPTQTIDKDGVDSLIPLLYQGIDTICIES